METKHTPHTSPEEVTGTGEIRGGDCALTPMQQGMLYMSISSPPDSGYYIEQVLCSITHPLDETRFVDAWKQVYGHYPVLSTAFLWEGQPRVRQTLHPEAALPVHHEDWVGESDPAARLAGLLERDRRRGFRLDAAPLTRVTLVQLAPDAYRCLWTVHHALVDGRAMAAIVQAVFRVYDALCQGEMVDLPAAAPFDAYVERFETPLPADTRRFWEETLGDFSEALDVPLPPPVPEPGVSKPAFAVVERTLSPALCASVEARAQAAGVSIGTLVQAGWALVLHRYTGCEDIVFGVTKSVRHGLGDVGEPIGLYINTLPLRVTVDSASSLDALVQEVRCQWLALRPHEHTPLSQIQAWSAVSGGSPLFNTVLMYERDTLDGLIKAGDGDWAGRHFELHECTPNPLTVAVYGGAHLRLTAEYDTSLFDAVAIGRMLGHLETVLAAMAETPGQLAGRAPLLTPLEQDQVLRQWQPPVWTVPFESVVSRFVHVAAGRPQHHALQHENKTMSYAELDARSRAVATHLVNLGVGPGVRAGLCVPRSFDLIVGMLAILRAGGAYVPIDPGYPDDRMDYIRHDAGLGVVLTVESLRRRWELTVDAVVCVDGSDAPASAGAAGISPPDVARAGDVAYAIYTSGSTGKPKGVLVHHEALAAFVHGATQRYVVLPSDRMLQFASPSFDAAVEEIFLALCNGMTLVLRTDAMLATADRFFQACHETGVTILDLPTAFWHVLVDGLGDAVFPPSIHTVIIGGEAAQPEKVARWRARVPAQVQLLNTYGPTETTVVATCAALHQEPASSEEAPIGRPLPGAAAYVLDKELQPLPIGVPGELCVGGVQVAKGYHQRDELTAQRFVANPFREGERLYRTGDKACFRPDGQLLYAGRFDRQIKLRGFRIELDGIESALRECPAVKEAAVTVYELAAGQQALAAYVVPMAQRDLGSVGADARNWLNARLPEYMQPAAYMALEALPMLTSRKVDYRALPAPQQDWARPLVPPETPTEERLVAIWMDVMQLPAISCEDDFFDLGGHSLLAMQLTARIRQIFQVELTLQDIFALPTVRRLGRYMDRQPKSAIVPEPVLPARRRGMAPLTFDQQILWLFEQVYPGTQSYLIPITVRLTGPLRIDLIEQALTVIVERHETLRTVFKLQGEAPVQLVRPPFAFTLDRHTLPYSPVDEREVRKWIVEQACKRMDIEEGPPIRGDILCVGPEDHVLCIVVHHLVADGWSVGVLVRELNVIHAALEGRAPSPLPPLPLQYGDYAHWQRQNFDEAKSPVVAYWREQLAGPLEYIEWPPNPTGASAGPRQGAQYPIHIDSETVAQLSSAGRSRGTSLFMKLLALFNLLLQRYTGASDIIVGATSANRNRLELEPLIGFFISTLPLRIRIDGVDTFTELLGRVRRVVLDAQTNQDIPFEVIRAITGHGQGKPPIPQVLFLMQTMDIPQLSLSNVHAQMLNVDTGKALTDLTLELYETGDGLAGWFEYSACLFSRETVARLVVLFQQLVKSVAVNPDMALEALPRYETVRARPIDVAPEVWVVPPALRRMPATNHVGGEGERERPRGELEEQMAALWQEVLRLPVVHRHDNFFRIGGHSLLAIILLQQIERRFHKRLAPIHIYQAPTVATLSKLLHREGEEPRRALHAIQPRGERLPLFFVGSTDLLPAIAEALGNDQPLYSLNIFGLQQKDGSCPFSNLEEVAALFLEEVRERQPVGPYAFGGYCRDTMVAYEMARQLQAQGEEVAHLALVDIFWDTDHVYPPWYRHLRNFWRMGPSYVGEKWTRRLKFFQEQFNRHRSRRAAAASHQRGAGLPHDHRNTLFINDYYDAVVAYEPGLYDGKVTIYMASEWGLTDAPGWRKLAAGGVDLLEFDACHYNIWRSPQAERLAALLRKGLEEVSAKPGP